VASIHTVVILFSKIKRGDFEGFLAWLLRRGSAYVDGDCY